MIRWMNTETTSVPAAAKAVLLLDLTLVLLGERESG
jgi:hypothetical protein